MEVELLHLGVIKRAHLVGTRIHDPDDTSLSVSSQAIGIDTKILNFAREAAGVTNDQGVEPVTNTIERSDDVVELTLDGVDASLEVVFSRVIFSGNHIDVQLLGSLSDLSSKVAVWLTRLVERVILLNENEGSVFGRKSLHELLRDLFVCEQQSTDMVEGFKAVERNVADVRGVNSMSNHQVAVEQVQAVSTSVAAIWLVFESQELVVLVLLRGREFGSDDLCVDLD